MSQENCGQVRSLTGDARDVHWTGNEACSLKLNAGDIFLDRYEVSHVIGEGAYGVVYKARQRMLDRDVAIKFLNIKDEVARKRFQMEARVIARLSSPSTVRVHDHGVAGEVPFMVLEFVGGRTLREIIDWRGPMSTGRASSIMIQILDSLREAHGLGVIHRDLKPQNIILSQPDVNDPIDRIKVLDFGMAQVRRQGTNSQFGQNERLTGRGRTVGTLRYMSPEQMRAKDLTPASDLFTLGLIAYEMVVGEHPYAALGNDIKIATELASSRPITPPPEAEVPEDFLLVLSKLLEKKAENRYQSAQDVIMAIDELDEATREIDDEPDGPAVSDPRFKGLTFGEIAPRTGGGRSYVSVMDPSSQSVEATLDAEDFDIGAEPDQRVFFIAIAIALMTGLIVGVVVTLLIS